MYDIQRVNQNLFACGTSKQSNQVVSLSTDNGNSWTDFSNGMNSCGGLRYPIANVLTLGNNQLVAGTYGHGVFLNSSIATNYVPQNLEQTKVDIIPNPSLDGHINLLSDKVLSGVSIYDLNGRCVLSNLQSKKQYAFELSDLPKGIYAVRIFENGKPFRVEKLAIQ